jgi:hypothetical protein
MNSTEAIIARVTQGRLGWAGPLIMLVARTGFIILAQTLVTLIYAWLGHSDPLKAGTAWWQVMGTLVDIGCLLLLFKLTRREGLRLMDLMGLDKRRLWRDALLGLGLLVVGFPLVMIGGAMLAGLLIYGNIQPPLPAEVLSKSLPLWAVLYARLVTSQGMSVALESP